MAVRFLYADRVKETSATAGTGPLALLGPSLGYVTFASVASANDYFRYTIVCPTTGAWEVGLGQLGPGPTIIRDKVESSTNAGGFVNFGTETKDVFLTSSAADFGHIHAFYFGSGSDGDRVITTGGAITLSQDTYYQNLTITGTGLLFTSGWKLFVRGVLDITGVTAGGGIAYSANIDGGAGGTSVGPAIPAGGAGGTGVAGVTMGGGVSGGAGGAGGAIGTTGGAGAPGTSASPSDGGGGGGGGTGGADVGAGGPGGAAGVASLPLAIGDYRKDLNRGVVQILGGASGGGGGAGGGGITAAGGGGGGGGASSGIVWISARILRRAGAAPGSISARGGAGGAGGKGFIIVTFVNPIASIFPDSFALPPWPRSEFALPPSSLSPSSQGALSTFPDAVPRHPPLNEGQTTRSPLIVISSLASFSTFPDALGRPTFIESQSVDALRESPVAEAFSSFPDVLPGQRVIVDSQYVKSLLESPAEAFTSFPDVLPGQRVIVDSQYVKSLQESPVAEAFASFPDVLPSVRPLVGNEYVKALQEAPVTEAFTSFPDVLPSVRPVVEGEYVKALQESSVAEAFTSFPDVLPSRRLIVESQSVNALRESPVGEDFTSFPDVLPSRRLIVESQSVNTLRESPVAEAFTSFPDALRNQRAAVESQSVKALLEAPVGEAFTLFPNALPSRRLIVESQSVKALQESPVAEAFTSFPNALPSRRLIVESQSITALQEAPVPEAFVVFPAAISRRVLVSGGEAPMPPIVVASPLTEAFTSFPDMLSRPRMVMEGQSVLPYAFRPNNYGTCRYYRLLYGVGAMAGLWQDTARTAPVTANGQIIEAADNQAPASTAIAWGPLLNFGGPTWQATGATFNGAQFLQTGTASTLAQAFTVITVARSTGAVGSYAQICDGVSGAARGAAILKDNAEKAGGYAGGAVVSLTHGWTTKALVTQVSNGASSRLRWRQGSTVEDSGLISLGTSALTGLTVGSSYAGSGSSPWVGDIEGIIVFSGVISGAALTLLEIDFANECGLVLT